MGYMESNSNVFHLPSYIFFFIFYGAKNDKKNFLLFDVFSTKNVFVCVDILGKCMCAGWYSAD